MKITLTAYWGDDCASSTVKISPKCWEQIQQGVEFSRSTWGYYEGRRFSVFWIFKNGLYSISGDDGMQCVVEESVDELIVE